ncbi:RNA polymerase sigma factor SigJ [Microbacterium paludicola]|uniref:RNA polymerase sigma factor SigJ n=1 Tax=Microbacterium paludicola TaxID=300019 RepID=UPI0011A79757|nr:RNA polymerase sigma factor SigJ [Microbacterium paludicola]
MDLAGEAPRLRPLMFSIAYRMLGSVTDAEDVVQSAMLKMHERMGAGDIERPDAFASTVTTRLAIDALRAARRSREVYVGPWLPEPLTADDQDPAHRVERTDAVSLAALRLMERLGPTERAVFVLRESVGLDFDEIAAIVAKEPAAVRQVLHRARKRLAADRARFTIDRAETERVVEQFLSALRRGDVRGILAVLAPDVVFTADGGGRVPAIQKPIQGAERVARFLMGLLRRVDAGEVIFRLEDVNGFPSVHYRDRARASLGVLTVVVAGGVIVEMDNLLNPDKLRHLGAVGDQDALLRAGSDAAVSPE